jgi:hypothetical protein
MNSLDRLDVLLQNVLERVADDKLLSMRDALLPAMPDVIASLRAIISDATTSSSTRLRANEMIVSLFSKVARLEDKEETREEVIAKATARTQEAIARKNRAKLGIEEIKAAELKKRIAHGKKVAKLLSGAEQKETT